MLLAYRDVLETGQSPSRAWGLELNLFWVSQLSSNGLYFVCPLNKLSSVEKKAWLLLALVYNARQ